MIGAVIGLGVGDYFYGTIALIGACLARISRNKLVEIYEKK